MRGIKHQLQLLKQAGTNQQAYHLSEIAVGAWPILASLEECTCHVCYIMCNDGHPSYTHTKSIVCYVSEELCTSHVHVVVYFDLMKSV